MERVIVPTTVGRNKNLIANAIKDRVVNSKVSVNEAMYSFYCSGRLPLRESWEQFKDKVNNLTVIKDAIKALHKLATSKPAVEKVIRSKARDIISQIDLPDISGVSSTHMTNIMSAIFIAGKYPPLGEILGIISKYLSNHAVLPVGEMRFKSLSYSDRYKEILIKYSMDTSLSDATREYLGKRATTLEDSNSWKFKKELPYVANKLGVPDYVVDEVVSAKPEVRLLNKSYYISKAEEVLIALIDSDVLDVQHYDWQIDAKKQASILIHPDLLDKNTEVEALNRLLITSHNEGGVSSFAPMWDVKDAGNKPAKQYDKSLNNILSRLNSQKFVYNKGIYNSLKWYAKLLNSTEDTKRKNKALWKLGHGYSLSDKDISLSSYDDIYAQLEKQVGQYDGGFYSQHGCDRVNRINSYNPIGHMSGSLYKYHIGTVKQYKVNSKEVQPLLTEAIINCQKELDKLKDKEDFSSLSKNIALHSRLGMLVKDKKRGWSNILAEVDVHNSGYQILAILTKNKKLAGLTAMLDGEDARLRDEVLDQFIVGIGLEPLNRNVNLEGISVKYLLMTYLYNIGPWKLVFNSVANGDDWDGLLAIIMSAYPDYLEDALEYIGVSRKDISTAFGQPDPMATPEELKEVSSAKWKIVNKLNKTFEEALFRVAPIVKNFRTMFNGLVEKYCTPNKSGEYIWKINGVTASLKPDYTYTEELGEFLGCEFTDFSVTVPNPEYRNGLLARVIQSLDAYILRLVLMQCFRENIQVLSQHDTFLVPFNKVLRVKDIYSEVVNNLPLNLLEEIMGSLVDKQYAVGAKTLVSALVGEDILFDGKDMLILEA